MPNIHIIIGDAHSRPDTNPRRFVALGNFLKEFASSHRQDEIKIIDMGDFEDMPSMSSWDQGKLDFEGRRFMEDVLAANHHRELVYGPLRDEICRIRSSKKRVPKVRNLALGGNHLEGRIDRYIQTHPELDGLIQQHWPDYESFGIEYVPFLKPLQLDGIGYCHYWQNRATGKPIGGGKYPAATILNAIHTSSVVGHSHILDRYATTNAAGKRLFSLVAGCYIDPGEVEKYAGQGNDAWWKGICVLHDVRDGYPEGGEAYVPVETLLAQYGG